MSHVAILDKQGEKYIVRDILEFQNVNYLHEMKNILKCDKLIIVKDDIKIGDTYDVNNNIFTDDSGNIKYNDNINTDKYLDIIEKKVEYISKLKDNLSDAAINLKNLLKMDKDEALDFIIKNIKKDCETVITSGFDARYPMSINYDNTSKNITLNDYENLIEKRHYSLSIDIINELDNTFNILRKSKDGSDIIYWKDDSLIMMEPYNCEDFKLLYSFLKRMVTTCRMYRDGLIQYATDLHDKNDINFMRVNWNCTLPKYIKDKIFEILRVQLKTNNVEYFYSHISEINYSTGEVIFK